MLPNDHDSFGAQHSTRMVDLGAQRLFRQEVPLYKPTAWYVPMPHTTLDDVVAPPGVWDFDSHKDGDSGMWVRSEFANTRLVNCEPLIRLKAQERMKAANSIINSREELIRAYESELKAYLPITADQDFITKLHDIHEPLPPPKISFLTAFEKSLYQPPIPRRPLKLYPLMMADHPISEVISRKTEEKRKRIQLLRRTPYGEVLLEEVFVGPDPDATTAPARPATSIIEASTMTGFPPDYRPADPPRPRPARTLTVELEHVS